MKKHLFCCAAIVVGVAHAETSVMITPTAQQAIFNVSTNQLLDKCQVQIWTVNSTGAQTLAADVDPQLFIGADQCDREGNLLGGGLDGDRRRARTSNSPNLTLVVGKRAVELDRSGLSKVSRSLQSFTEYQYKITIGTDAVMGKFTTLNIPLGNTYNEPVFDRARPGEYAYPTIDWTEQGKSKTYIDPLTGLGIKRVSGPGQFGPTVEKKTFQSAAGGANWTVTGLQGVYDGSSRSMIYYRIADPSWPGRGTMPLDFVTLTLAGASSSGSRAVNVCLTNDGSQCAGAILTQALTKSRKDYVIGSPTPILRAWRNSPNPPSTLMDIRTLSGNAMLSGTTATWTSGDLFSTKAGAGSYITLGDSDCQISSVINEQRVELRSGQMGNCATNGNYAFTERNWGFLIWDAYDGTDTLTIKSASWTLGTSGFSYWPAWGGSDLCQPLNVPGPTGNGHLCANSTSFTIYPTAPVIFWIGDDGTVNQIGMANGNSSDLFAGGLCSPQSWAWDRTTAGRYYCLGTQTSDRKTVIFSVQYRGKYDNVGPIPTDSSLSPATTTILAGDINSAVAAFNPAFSKFTPNTGWTLVGQQNNDLILQVVQSGQNSPGWIAVFHIPNKSIIAAFSTYGGSEGSANRWDGVHTMNTTGDTQWLLISGGSLFDLPYTAKVINGSLTSSYSACPANSFGVTGAQCSQVTVDSLTPTNPSGGGTLFSQQLLPGDFMNVTKGGEDDHEQVRIMAISGNTLWLQRAVRTYYYGLNNTHTGPLNLRVATAVLHELWVNYVDDPTAKTLTKPFGLTVLEDPQTSDCHQVYSMGVFLAGCLKYPGLKKLSGSAVRIGALPSSLSTTSPWNNQIYSNGMNAPFLTANYTISANLLETHPSRSQYLVPDDPSSLDARPYLGDPLIASSTTTSKVGRFTYRVSAAGIAKSSNGDCKTCVLNYRLQPFLVTSGSHPVVDTSPQMSDTPASHFTYCYVVVMGDCWSNSKLGEVYVNVPHASMESCYPTRFSPNPSLSDICVTANTFTANRVLQTVNVSEDDTRGAYTRGLTSFFSPYKTEDVFWNVRATPDGKWFLGKVVDVGGERTEIMMGALPPLPQPASNPGAFADVSVPVEPIAAKVRARFGYTENGKATQYYCTSRQVACTTGGAPFSWADEPQRLSDCTSGCMLHIPAIPGHILYYTVEHSIDGITWTSDPTEVVAAVPSDSPPVQLR